MLAYDVMYPLVEPSALHFVFCIDSGPVAQRSLRHRALVNATIQSKFPSKRLLPSATARVEDALRGAVRALDHRGKHACGVEVTLAASASAAGI
jgi:hypothetical protein